MAIEYRSMGKRIRAFRTANDMTQGDLAAACGISTSFMGHIERGSRIASLETLVKIADVFHESVDVLLGRDEEQRGDRLMRHDDEKKKAALESMEKIGVPKTHEATGISMGTLYKWRTESKGTAEAGGPIDTARALLAEDDGLLAKISELEAENQKLRASNDKLKKALLAFIE